MPSKATPPDDDVLFARALHHRPQQEDARTAVHLTVRRGECLAVTGGHASGKSSLLRCLAGQVRSYGGELWFGGTPLHGVPAAARDRLRRERFGWVGSTPALVHELTVWENAALPLMLGGSTARTARAGIVGWLERLDIGDCADQRPAELDSAQRQRVALARALAHEPTVLFADEPAAGLPRREGALLLRTLAAVARSHHITVVLSALVERTPPGPGQDSQWPHTELPRADHVLHLAHEQCATARPVLATKELDSASCSLSV